MNRTLSSLYLMVIGLVLLLGQSVAYGLDSPLTLKARSLTGADRLWLAQQAASSTRQVLTQIILQDPLSSLTPKTETVPAFSLPNFANLPIAPAAISPLELPDLAKGISIEQSGQVLRLPLIANIAATQSTADQILGYWLNLDMKPLVSWLARAQIATGWSDLELAKLMQRYVSTSLPIEQQSAFLASLWHQAGYQVQIAQTESKQSILFYRLDTPVYQLPMVRVAGSYWYALQDSGQAEVEFPENIARHGQALRLRALNDRSRTNQYFKIPMQFAGKPAIGIELPAHWASIPRLPLALEKQFQQVLPDYVLQIIERQLAGDDAMTKTRNFAQWLNDDFQATSAQHSIHQALVYKQLNAETRLILLAAWWRYLTQQSVAIVRNEAGYALALKLDKPMSLVEAVEYRKNRWWLWRDNLTIQTQGSTKADWHFLP